MARPAVAILFAGVVLAGCDAGLATPTPFTPGPAPTTAAPSSQATVTPSPTTSAAPAGTPSPTAVPSAAPGASPGTGTGQLPGPSDPPLSSPCGRDLAAPASTSAPVTAFRWTDKQKIAFRSVQEQGRLAPTSAGWVYQGYDDLRFSPDLVHWKRITLDGLTKDDTFTFDPFAATASLASAAGGIVAFGTIEREDPVTFDMVERQARIASQDGGTWTAIPDPAIASATILNAGSTGCELIVTGTAKDGTPSVWTSPDGLAWTASSDPDATSLGDRTVGFATGPGRVLAFAGDPIRKDDIRVKELEVWASSDGQEWDRLGTLPGSARAIVRQTAYGNGHWLVLGDGRKSRPFTWTSTDGVTWKRIARKNVVGVTDLAGYTKGFIATGAYGDAPGTTCGSGAPYVGRTWVSDDGAAWTEVSRSRGVAILSIAALDGRLYGLGNSTRDDKARLWWGALPGVASAYGPATLGPLPPGTGGCGD